jgi:hypothetical protein
VLVEEEAEAGQVRLDLILYLETLLQTVVVMVDPHLQMVGLADQVVGLDMVLLLEVLFLGKEILVELFMAEAMAEVVVGQDRQVFQITLLKMVVLE